MGEGHNHVRSIFERWRRLEEDKAAIGEDMKELFQEAKSAGFDTKALRAAFRLKVADENRTDKDEEHDALVDSYMAALTGTAVATQARIAREKGIHESPSNRDVSAGGKAWESGAPQGNQNPPQAKAEAGADEPSEPAVREGHSEREGVYRAPSPIHHGLTPEQVAERDALADQWEAKMLRRAQ